MYGFVITTGPTVNVKVWARRTWMLNRAIQDEARARRAANRREVTPDAVPHTRAVSRPMAWPPMH
jgi:hypothetical protein